MRSLIVILVLSLAPMAAHAAPSEQFLRSIENRLKIWNVGPVDVSKLTTSQTAQLHLSLTNAPSRFGTRAAMFRQELLNILRKDQ